MSKEFDGMSLADLIIRLRALASELDGVSTEVCLGDNCCSSDYVPIENLAVRMVPDEKGNLVKKVMLYVKEDL